MREIIWFIFYNTIGRVIHLFHCGTCQFNLLEKTTFHHFIFGGMIIISYIRQHGWDSYAANLEHVMESAQKIVRENRYKLLWLFVWYCAYGFIVYRFILALLKLL